MGDTGQSTSNGGGSGTSRQALANGVRGSQPLSHVELANRGGYELGERTLQVLSQPGRATGNMNQLMHELENASRKGDRITHTHVDRYNNLIKTHLTKLSKNKWKLEEEDSAGSIHQFDDQTTHWVVKYTLSEWARTRNGSLWYRAK